MIVKMFPSGLVFWMVLIIFCQCSSSSFSSEEYVQDLIVSFKQQTGFEGNGPELETYVRDLLRDQGDSIAWDSLNKYGATTPLEVDPDAKKDLTELITSQGYPVEKYVVQTKDGFLLDLHRIPYGRNQEPGTPGPPVFLQHGLVSSACDWVLNFPNNSLGLLLADNGYDVWLGNTRGNTYSKRHVHWTTDDLQFWDWSFDEMAKYDTTAFIDFILEKNGHPSLYYVGHSQGTVMAFALFAFMPEYEKKVRLFVGLAPIISVANMRSPAKFFLVDDERMYEMLGRKEVFPNSLMVKMMADTVCIDPKTQWICISLIFLINGFDKANYNASRTGVYMNHSPAGSSAKAIVHFSQMYNSGTFSMFDYGTDWGNMEHYNQNTPPEYDVTKITVPSLLFSGPRDWMAGPDDVAILVSKLPNIQAHYVVPKWTHLDLVWGLNARTECFDRILEWLPKF